MPKFNVTIESADGTMTADVGGYEAADQETAIAEVLEIHASATPHLVSVVESFD